MPDDRPPTLCEIFPSFGAFVATVAVAALAVVLGPSLIALAVWWVASHA